LKGMSIAPRLSKEGRLLVTVSLERSYCVEIEEHGRFARLTGYPEIGFDPKKHPQGLLGHLLLRNGESNAGGWRLIASANKVWVGYSHFVPLKHLSISSLVCGLEIVLSEINQFAFEYRYFKRA
jgi:hypothetical protein